MLFCVNKGNYHGITHIGYCRNVATNKSLNGPPYTTVNVPDKTHALVGGIRRPVGADAMCCLITKLPDHVLHL